MFGNENELSEECQDEQPEPVSIEMLVGAGYLGKAATTKKADKRLERQRLEAIDTARAKFYRSVDFNRKTLESLSMSAEYGIWFEAFNGERAVLDDLKVLGSDPAGLQFGLAFNIDLWVNRAIRAAARKGMLWEMLFCCKNGRERRIIRVRLATPPWVDYEKIRQIYVERDRINKLTGIPHHVDHIVPLAGRRATGLHVHDNLQIITAAENMAKLNKFNDWA